MSALPAGTTRMTYARARQLLLSAGLTVLLLIGLFMYARRVDTAEVLATLLFIPVFIGFVFQGLRGGLIAAALAIVAYIGIRYPAIEKVGASALAGLILSRALAFVAFGAIGGWANQQLETSLNKLELYDQIDDDSRLFNARSFLQDTDLEMSRSKRYQTIFSVAVVDFPAAPLQQLSRRKKSALIRELGNLLRGAIRAVDRAVHGFDGTRHRFAVVLPETGVEGARTFSTRLGDRILAYLQEKRLGVERGDVDVRTVTYPEDGDAALQAVRDEFAAIDRLEHPEAAA